MFTSFLAFTAFTAFCCNLSSHTDQSRWSQWSEDNQSNINGVTHHYVTLSAIKAFQQDYIYGCHLSNALEISSRFKPWISRQKPVALFWQAGGDNEYESPQMKTNGEGRNIKSVCVSTRINPWRSDVRNWCLAVQLVVELWRRLYELHLETDSSNSISETSEIFSCWYGGCFLAEYCQIKVTGHLFYSTNESMSNYAKLKRPKMYILHFHSA